MVKIDNALGKGIQITDSLVYSKIGSKTDFLFNLNYDILLMSVRNLAFGLSECVGVDPQVTNLYVSLYGLGCVDGGRATIDYFNSKLETNKMISNYDIMLFNLKQVFPNMEQTFSKEDLKEFEHLFSGSSDSKEIQIVRIAYFLKMVERGYIKTGKLNNDAASDYIYTEMKQIVSNYERTGKLGISAELNSRINYFYAQKEELSNSQAAKVDEIRTNYLNSFNKDIAIAQLNDLKLEKKTKVR